MVSSQRCVCHRSCLVEEALLNVESDADVREMWKERRKAVFERCLLKWGWWERTSLRRGTLGLMEVILLT